MRPANVRDKLSQCPFRAGGDRQAQIILSQDLRQPCCACLDLGNVPVGIELRHGIPSFLVICGGGPTWARVPTLRTLHVGLRVSNLDPSLAFYRAAGYTVTGTVDGTPVS
jgi:hypothetical protein